MRTVVFAAVLLAGWCLGAAPAQAQPAAPVAACTPSDKRLVEVSGLAADGERWYAVSDGGKKSTVLVLTKDCAVERAISGPTDPYDVEDLARAPDGTFWLADTGDNRGARATVAVISLTGDGNSTLYRLTYPDGAHDTEALLLDRQGVPYLITKNPTGAAEIYRPAGALASPGPTALQHVGSIQLHGTDTPGGPVPGIVGSMLITGAASNADGTVIAVRTYTDAYLWGVPDGDLLAALGKDPVRVPLPNEAQGEAIAFEPDGALVSASEGTGTPHQIRIVSGAADLVAPKPPPSAAAPGSGAGTSDAAPAAKDGLPALPAAGVTAIILAGVVLFLRRRRRA